LQAITKESNSPSRIEGLREAIEDEAVKGSNAGVRTSSATAVTKKPRITIGINEMTSSTDLEAGKGREIS
jgi:hypothetical protein